jgi:predicted hydrocarbon binding protein
MATNKDIRIPADSIQALRRSLVSDLGGQAAGRALQAAGFAAGDALFDRLTRTAGDEGIEATPSASFWDRLAALFRELGWGVIRHEDLHPGVGALVATEWFEVGTETGRATCPFTTGVLANLLGRAAGADVSVLQVGCESEGAGCARFLFGSAAALDGLYSELREGQDLEAALGALR